VPLIPYVGSVTVPRSCRGPEPPVQRWTIEATLMLANEAPIVVVDFETTGVVSGHPDVPWQVGMVSLEGGRVRPETLLTSLLRTGDRPFNRFAPGRHAELAEEIAAAPTLPEIWPELCDRLCGRPLAAHNVATERKVIQDAFPLHTFGPWLDTLKLARIAWPDLVDHKLETVALRADVIDRTIEVCPGRVWHDALFDAVACAFIFETLLTFPGWDRLTVNALEKARPRRYRQGR